MFDEVPTGHSSHEAGEVAPTVAEYLPTGHDSQRLAPEDVEYFPAPHWLHCGLPS
jgi:hypothetical protein